MSSFASKGRFSIESDFTGAAIDPGWVGTTENSGTAAIVVAKDGGVVNLVTGTSSGNRSALTSGLNVKSENGSLIFEAIVMNLTAVTNRATFIGLTDTVSIEMPIELSGVTLTSSATDAVGFVYDTAATTDVVYIQGVNTDVDTALKAAALPSTGAAFTPAAGTYDEYRIEVNTDGYASFYINGDYVGGVSSAVSPSVLLTPIVIVEARTTAAQTVYVDQCGVEAARERTP
jgi:hypothetical protein